MVLGAVAKPLAFRKDGPRPHTPGSPAGMARGCTALEAPLEALLLPGTAGAFAVPWQPRRALSNAERAAAATGLLWVHLLTSLPFAHFVPVINSQSSWTPQLNSCWVDRSSSITEGEREMGLFRKDMLLETCPCCGNAWERPDTICLFRLLSLLHPSLLFFANLSPTGTWGRCTFPFSGFRQSIWVDKRAGQTKKIS